MTFISRNSNFRIIRKFMNSLMGVRVVLVAYRDSSLVRTLNSRGKKIANVSKNKVLANISEFTVNNLQ